MDDVLELGIDDNEFNNEEFSPFKAKTVKTFGGKNLKPAAHSISCASTSSSCSETSQNMTISSGDLERNSTLEEAKKDLLQRLSTIEQENGGNALEKTSKVARISVKSRLGKRENLNKDIIESMDCDTPFSETGDSQREMSHKEHKTRDSSTSSGYKQQNERYSVEEESRFTRWKRTKLCKRLRVKSYDSPEMIGKEIAERLEEPKFHLIINIVKTIGGEKAFELFSETKKIQLGRGMTTSNGDRRRTSGGVFLTLLKEKYATEEEVKKLLRDDAKTNIEKIKRKRILQRKKKREKERANKTEQEMVIEEQGDCVEAATKQE